MSVPNDYIDDPMSGGGGGGLNGTANNPNSNNAASFRARQKLPSRQNALFPNSPECPATDYLEVHGPSSHLPLVDPQRRVYTVLNPDSFYYETAVLGSAAVNPNGSLIVNGASECRCSSSESIDSVSGMCTKGTNIGSSRASASCKSKVPSAELVLTMPLHGCTMHHNSCPSCSHCATNGSSDVKPPSALESGGIHFTTPKNSKYWCGCRRSFMRYLLLGALCALLLGIVAVISVLVVNLKPLPDLTIGNNPSRTDRHLPSVVQPTTSTSPSITIVNRPNTWYLNCDEFNSTLAEEYYKTSCNKEKGQCMARLKSYTTVDVAANDNEELRRLYNENAIYVDKISCLCNDGTSGGPKCTLHSGLLKGRHSRRRRSLFRPHRTY